MNRKVEVTMEVGTTADRIIHAFTDEHMLRKWWSVERALIQKKVNGVYALAWNINSSGFGFVSTGVIKIYEPKHELVIENFTYLNPQKAILGPMTLVVRATQHADHADLYLCQHGYQYGGDWDWYYESVQQAWPVVAKTLKEHLENVSEI